MQGRESPTLPVSGVNPSDSGRVINEAISVIQSVDAVEQALAKALEAATAAGEWSAVIELARQLEARRQARADVIDLQAQRAKRQI